MVRAKKEDMIGKKVNMLTVIDKAKERSSTGRPLWLCRCECGNTRKVLTSLLNKGSAMSCGCFRKGRDIAGKKFGKLTAIHREGSNGNKWLCRCECGNEKLIRTQNLTAGTTISCGCISGWEGHGKTYSPEYRVWSGIKRRCNNPKSNDYKNYGDRGISVCRRWELSFSDFLEDMGERPDSSYSIERINNNEGYNPDNCVWAKITTQNRNRRVNKNNKSGYSGVNITKSRKWKASITADKVVYNLGIFTDKQDAIDARLKAEKKYWNK